MRRVIVVLLVILPQGAKRWMAKRFLGWDIHPTAHLGWSLVKVRYLSMGAHTTIGSFNLIWDLEELRLEEGANIASHNWIAGIPPDSPLFVETLKRDPSLVMGPYSLITIDHSIDCADRVELEANAAIAGFRSVVLTHSLNFMTDQFDAAPVVLRDHAALLSGCTMMMGTEVPARSIVSAGSVVTTKLTAEQTFYRGNPAEALRELPRNLRFFKRNGWQPQIGAARARLRDVSAGIMATDVVGDNDS